MMVYFPSLIEEFRSKKEEVRRNVYDLQGRKVTNATKGIVIKDGKKMVNR
jgi:hypothetical protein